MKTFKLVALDIDGLLTRGLSWARFNAFVGITPAEDQRMYDDYYIHHTLTFTRWNYILDQRYQESGKTKRDFEIFAKNIEWQPFARELVAALNKRYETWLISGALEVYVSDVARQLGISHFAANYAFEYDPDGTVKRILQKGEEGRAKEITLKQICKNKKIMPEEIVFIGDSTNDLEAFRFTNHGILVGEGNENLRQACWKHVRTLSDVLPILLPD